MIAPINAKEHPMRKFDCIVVGGGPGGAVAAIAAGRLGLKTLIVEQQGCLGGALTSMGVAPMMTFHDFTAGQTIRGIAEEVVQRLVKTGGSPGHVPDSSGYVATVTPFDPEILKIVYEEMAREAKVTLLYHTMLAGATVRKKRIQSIAVCNKAGLSELKAALFIDGTGDGDLSAWAGVPCDKGRERDGRLQPGTRNLMLSNVNIAAIRDSIRKNPGDFRLLHGNVEEALNTPRLCVSGYYGMIKRAREAGAFSIPRDQLLFFEGPGVGRVNVNVSRVLGVDGTDPWSLSAAEIEGRRQVLEIYRFLRERIPGFENAVMHAGSDRIGIRETRRIRGLHVLTAEELWKPVRFEDAVAACSYPIDLHSPTGVNTLNDDSHDRPMPVYTIPYRSLVNATVVNLIACGRCISATHEALAAVRTTPTCMATGQAAGTAAALAKKKGNDATKVDSKQLVKRLVKDGVWLPAWAFERKGP
ncbi:MAG: FAD-dependent oxidoreductase [Fibrobacterota bacterium]